MIKKIERGRFTYLFWNREYVGKYEPTYRKKDGRYLFHRAGKMLKINGVKMFHNRRWTVKNIIRHIEHNMTKEKNK